MSWWRKLLGIEPSPKEKRIPSWPEVQISIEKQMAPQRQEWEDRKWRNEIETRARRRLHDWEWDKIMIELWEKRNEGKELKEWWNHPSIGIRIEEPFSDCYMLHDEATAKYKSCNFDELISQRFEELKQETENET